MINTFFKTKGEIMITEKERVRGRLRRTLTQIGFDIPDLKKCIFVVAISYLSSSGRCNLSKNEISQNFSQLIDFKNIKVLEPVVPVIELITDNISSDIYQQIVDYVDEMNGGDIGVFIQEYFGTNFRRMYNEIETPNDINDLLVKLANIRANDTVLDPCCGVGGTLLTIIKNNPQQRVYGQDINPLCVAITEMLLDINGSTNHQLFVGDSLLEPQYVKDGKLMNFDVVITEPPFAVQFPRSLNDLDKYDRYSFGKVPYGKADWGFIMNAISSSKESSGRIVLLLPTGVLFRGGLERGIRHNVLKEDLFETVISLPGGLLPSTSIPTSVLVFNRDKTIEHKNKVLFIKVPKEGTLQIRRNLWLKSDEIEKIVNANRNFTEIENYSLLVPIDQISDDSMMVERYIKKTVYNFDDKKYLINLIDYYSGDTIPLENISKIDRGYNMISKNESLQGKYWIMRISDMDSTGISYTKMSRGDVEERTKVDNYELQNGDIVMAVRGSFKLLKVEDIRPNTLINSNLVRLRVNSSVYDPQFLKLFINSPIGRAQLEDIMVGTTVRQIPIKSLSQFEVPKVDLDKQKKFVQDYLHKSDEIKAKIKQLQDLQDKFNQELYRKMGLDGLYQIDDGGKDK